MIPEDIANHINARIRKIQGRRRGDPEELRSHILDAMQSMETAAADAAFAALGDDSDIRATFFPAKPRPAIDAWVWVGLGLALLAIALQGIIDGNEAACSAGPGETCSSSSVGAMADMAMLALGPLTVFAVLRWGSIPWALLPASVLLFFALMRLLSGLDYGSTTQIALDASVFTGAILTAAVATRHFLLQRALT